LTPRALAAGQLRPAHTLDRLRAALAKVSQQRSNELAIQLLALLPPVIQRPRRRAAEQRDKLAAGSYVDSAFPDLSFDPSSARPSSGSGTVRPKAVAVF